MNQPESTFADFQNDALLGRDDAPPSDKAVAHEDAAHEPRNWVRLTNDCNNHCTFCLDSHAHDGTMRSNLDIKIQIIEGKKRGAERLILSGGEPTMHPNFLDFVRLGKRAGYAKVQTVTNGRMFKYPSFLDTAAKNGLDEITFSLHGHTAKLHDALVGTPGAFDDEVAGLKAALASGRFIVNIDTVINKQNVRVLPEMLETFIGWGVKEFDLLHVIPFGNAWGKAREHLFYDLDGNLELLQRAFAYARRPDVHLWLNRFPPPYAEGFEDLIQDPYKLEDEVRGRREEYDRYLSLGQKLSCREPERCKVCYLQTLCDGLDEALALAASQAVDVVRLDAAPPRAELLPQASRARVVAPNLELAEALVRSVTADALELELGSYDGLAEALGEGTTLFGKRLVRCDTPSARELMTLLGLAASFDVGALLTRETEPAIRALGVPSERLILIQRNYDRVSEARERDVDLPAFFASYPCSVRVENVPACIAGRPTQVPARTLDLAMLGPDARVDMSAYTRRFIADGFYTKALRCRHCALDASCRGVHVNWVRAHGFDALAPIEEKRAR